MKIDVVFLNQDTPLLKYEVIKDGTIIKDNEERAEFESLSIREYFDFKYFSDYYDECMLNHLKKVKKAVYDIIINNLKDIEYYFMEVISEYI